MRHTDLLCLALIAFFPAIIWAREPLPDAELLEFLGRYETSTGKAIDPLQFVEQDAAHQQKEQTAVSKTATLKLQVDSRRKPQKDQAHEK